MSDESALKIVGVVGVVNAIFYSAAISTSLFPNALTGLRFDGAPLLIESIDHLASLEPFSHYLFYNSTQSYTVRSIVTLVCLAVQLVVTIWSMIKHPFSKLPADLVAYYWWCFSASLVFLGAVLRNLAVSLFEDSDAVYFATLLFLAFVAWWHVYYDILIPLGLHLETPSQGWNSLVKWGCFPFAVLAIFASFLVNAQRSNSYFQNLHLNALLNLQLFAHGAYWILVAFRAWTGQSNGSQFPQIQKYINWALAWHALHDMSNQYYPNPEGSNANTSLVLCFNLMCMNLGFAKYMKERDVLLDAKSSCSTPPLRMCSLLPRLLFESPLVLVICVTLLASLIILVFVLLVVQFVEEDATAVVADGEVLVRESEGVDVVEGRRGRGPVVEDGAVSQVDDA